MKKHILGLALVVTMLGALATGCSSAKKTDGSDSTTVKDTTKVTDTTKKDTSKTDTTKKM